MRTASLSLAVLLAAATTAAAASLAAQEGRWVCLPDDPAAPQVMVDFEERLYRRCDQNTCASYDILSVRHHAGATEIAFAPGAILHADDAGARYREIRVTGGATITASGGCTFRGYGPDSDALGKEHVRQRG